MQGRATQIWRTTASWKHEHQDVRARGGSLEHKISIGGVLMIFAEDQRLASTEEGKEVAMFLGLGRYYHTFIPHYSVLTNWLSGIKKAEKFLWNEEIE